MQTFLPLPSILDSVQVLDWRRLGKQRVEAMQILRTLSGQAARRGWVNHPAVKMWRGHADALGSYMDTCIVEWQRRGYRNTMFLSGTTGPLPSWFGDPQFHASHRSNLLRKDSEWYGQFGWSEPVDLPYVWPVNNERRLP